MPSGRAAAGLRAAHGQPGGRAARALRAGPGRPARRRRGAARGLARLVAAARRIAAALGVRYEETLTGFKWIANARAIERTGARFVFGYEEALGYTVGDVVRDKDGFGAALAMLRLAEEAKSADRSVLNVYDDLERTLRRRT